MISKTSKWCSWGIKDLFRGHTKHICPICIIFWHLAEELTMHDQQNQYVLGAWRISSGVHQMSLPNMHQFVRRGTNYASSAKQTGDTPFSIRRCTSFCLHYSSTLNSTTSHLKSCVNGYNNTVVMFCYLCEKVFLLCLRVNIMSHLYFWGQSWEPLIWGNVLIILSYGYF